MTDPKILRWLDDFSLNARSGTDLLAVAEIRKLLAQPRLPDELSPELIEAIWNACNRTFSNERRPLAHAVLGAIRDWVTRPPIKNILVWHCEYAWRASPNDRWEVRCHAHTSCGMATAEANELRKNPEYACVLVTGPYEQRVPA